MICKYNNGTCLVGGLCDKAGECHALPSERATPEAACQPRSLALAPCSAFIRRSEVQVNQLAFLGAIDRAIEFHRTNTNDPHNVGTAVMVALSEVRDCFKAYLC
jgi:hypothetical protein